MSDLYVVQISHDKRNWSNQYDLLYEFPEESVLQQVATANPGLYVRWIGYIENEVTSWVRVKGDEQRTG